MKKRHEQKLVVLSFSVLLIFSLPFILAFNCSREIMGIPMFYFGVFLVWLLSIIISYTILAMYYE